MIFAAVRKYGPNVEPKEKSRMRKCKRAIVAITAIMCWGILRAEGQTSMHPATSRPTTRRVENHDEGAAWYWMLPDPFRLSDGETVKDAATWLNRRRPEILGLFEREIYGRAPGRPEGESFEVVESG